MAAEAMSLPEGSRENQGVEPTTLEYTPPTPQRHALVNSKQLAINGRLLGVAAPARRKTIESLDDACLQHIFSKLDYPVWLVRPW